MKKIYKRIIKKIFERSIMSSNAVYKIKKLYKIKFFKYMLKDQHINNMFGFDQRNIHHNETLDRHVLKVLQKVIKENPNATLELRLAAFLHDIGKLDCYQIKEDGYHYSYHGHEIESGKVAYNILKEMNFSDYICDKVKFIIERHMILKTFNDGNGHLKITEKSAKKIIRKCGNYLNEILQLMDADNKSHATEASNRLWFQIEDFKILISNLNEEKEKNNKIPINGNDVMTFFNILPGPKVKKLLIMAEDIYEKNKNLNKEEILNEIKNIINICQ